MHDHYLTALFCPRSVAVFGASEQQDSVGKVLFGNLLDSGFAGTVYPINPKYERIVGIATHPNLDDIREPIDLAIIVTPAATVPAIIDACGRNGVKAAIIISAGFH